MTTAILTDNHREDGGPVAVEVEHVDDAQVFVGLTSGDADFLLTLSHADALALVELLVRAVRPYTAD